MEGSDGGPPGTGNTVSGLVSVSGQQSTFSATSFPTSNIQWGRSLSEAIGASKSLWTDSAAAPGLCKRYIKGQLTNQPLWPWAMDKRISDALVQAGYPAMSVTATMESFFGNPSAMSWDWPDPGENRTGERASATDRGR